MKRGATNFLYRIHLKRSYLYPEHFLEITQKYRAHSPVYTQKLSRSGVRGERRAGSHQVLHREAVLVTKVKGPKLYSKKSRGVNLFPGNIAGFDL